MSRRKASEADLPDRRHEPRLKATQQLEAISTNFLDLPDDIIVQITQILASAGSFGVAATCKRLRDISKSNIQDWNLINCAPRRRQVIRAMKMAVNIQSFSAGIDKPWKSHFGTLPQRHPTSWISAKALTSLTRVPQFRSVQRLSFVGVKNALFDPLPSLSKLTNLRWLNLNNSEFSFDSLHAATPPVFAQLEAFHGLACSTSTNYIGSTARPAGIFRTIFPQLKDLTVKAVHPHLLHGLPHLARLDYTSNGFDSHAIAVMANSCPLLKHLVVKGHIIYAKQAKPDQWTSLVEYNPTADYKALLEEMAVSAPLQSLQLFGDNNTVYRRCTTTLTSLYAVLTTEEISTLANCTRLTALDILSLQCTDEAFALLTDSCRQLKSLRITQCRTISDMAFNAMGSCTALQRLWLSNLESIGLYALWQISKCDNLRDLYLRNTPITDAAFQKLRTCKRLRILQIGQTDISERALQTVISSCRHIEALDIRCCPQLGDSAVRMVAIGCRSLKRFAFGSDCSDASLNAISMNCTTELQELVVTASRRITLCGYQKLITCSALRWLYVDHGVLEGSDWSEFVTQCGHVTVSDQRATGQVFDW